MKIYKNDKIHGEKSIPTFSVVGGLFGFLYPLFTGFPQVALGIFITNVVIALVEVIIAFIGGTGGFAFAYYATTFIFDGFLSAGFIAQNLEERGWVCTYDSNNDDLTRKPNN